MIFEKKLKHGLLIAIEGIDGAGKSTQAKILYRILKERGYNVKLLHEPTDGSYGKIIKESAINGRLNPEEELKYFIEDRKEDVDRNIKPALEDKMIVIMDRYYFSTIAYQGARSLDSNEIKKINEQFAPRPDLTILLDVAPTIGLSRIRENRINKSDYFEKSKYLIEVREIFGDIENSSIQTIDGNREIDVISNEILNITMNIVKPIEIAKLEIKR